MQRVPVPALEQSVTQLAQVVSIPHLVQILSHAPVDVLGSSKYRSQVKSIPSEVHNAAIITCARTSLSINESCEFPLKTSFI